MPALQFLHINAPQFLSEAGFCWGGGSIYRSVLSKSNKGVLTELCLGLSQFTHLIKSHINLYTTAFKWHTGKTAEWFWY